MYLYFFRNHSLLNNTINFFTRGKYSHVSILSSNGYFYEADIKYGVRKVKKEDYLVENKNSLFDIKKLTASEWQESQIIEFLEKQVGKKYDIAMVIGFVIHSTRESRKSYGKWFCSELLVAGIEKGGIKLFNTEPWKISPEILSWSTLLN